VAVWIVDAAPKRIYTRIPCDPLLLHGTLENRMTAPSQDFGHWLSAARGGSRDALGRAFEACRRYLLSVAHDQLNPDLRAKGGASDLVQETFLEAQSAFERFRGNSEVELRAWLRQLLHHRAAKFRRHYRTTQKRRLARETTLTAAGDPSGPAAERSSPSAQLVANEQAQRLREALERLPDDYRRVITLRYVEQCPFDEIGRLMQRTPNAARLLWLRAIEHVKHHLRSRDEP
jgi:RNA polymerase sigma-70 factor (ECF subfamily)